MSLVDSSGRAINWSALNIAALPRPSMDREAAMAAAAADLWSLVGDSKPDEARPSVSWLGFYELAHESKSHGAVPGEAMVLGPHEPKPACSPIGLHGACGKSFTTAHTLIVRDVAKLGEGYVACDPRDRSELVIPLMEGDRAWAVLDLDSFATNAFDDDDADHLERYCLSRGLTTAPIGSIPRSII